MSNIGLLLLATAAVARAVRRYLGAAFNPVTLNLDDLPAARRCRRRRPERAR